MSALTRILGIVLAIAVIALPVVAVMQGWLGAERFALTRLQVTSEFRHVNAAQLQQTLKPYAAQGFFAVRLKEAQQAVEQLPWVEQAEISKQWPDVLKVKIVEHRPFALWDEDWLLSERGNLYPRAVMGDALPAGLPQLGGDRHRVQEVVTLYNLSRQLFAAAGLDVTGLRLDARGSWSIHFDNGLEVMVGRHDAELRIRRFAQLLPQLIAPPGKTLQRADLRYANGFALRWGSIPEVAGQSHSPVSTFVSQGAAA
ncbi:cell division protein FtsQ [Lysobacteraceae bacterium NML75-0749]|nr:cell division protein FtsQ [Xanthomonadaceae bacterium NML75-0749]PJK06012.1 cell division protein FtsQ [Xanthomonadaceae bacterium NML91-0268]